MKRKDFVRFVAKCKDEKFLTYAVWDRLGSKWVKDTEDTDLSAVEQYATDENDNNEPAPPHGSMYGEPCGDRK